LRVDLIQTPERFLGGKGSTIFRQIFQVFQSPSGEIDRPLVRLREPGEFSCISIARVGKENIMLYYALLFLVVAVIAGVLGFSGIAGTSAGIAQVLFFLFLAFLVISLIIRAIRSV
jgi:uncharacterized membrane protein YtjA (UPF0391 family)